MEKIVIDTNVILSALMTSGSCRKVLNLWSENKFQLYISPSIISEITSVGKRSTFRKYFTLTQLEILLDLIKNNAHLVSTIPDIPSKYLSSDPKDNIFIAVVLSEKIDAFVTGNHRHFTNIKNITRVSSPSEFLNNFNSR